MKTPKILVIRFSSIGDILLTFPVYRNLKAAWPDAEITVLTKSQFSGLFTGLKEVDKVALFKGLRATLKDLKKEKYDILIDLHSTPRSFLFRKFLKAGKKIKYRKDSLYRRIFVNFRIMTPALQKHTVERYLETVSRLGLPIKDSSLYLQDLSYLKPERKTEDPKKILIIQTAFLGDSLLTLPLIKEIKKRFPLSGISVLTRKETVQVFEKTEGVDEVLADNKKGASFFKEFFRLSNELKKRNFDTVFIPHRSLRSAALAFFSKIPARIGFDLWPASLFYTDKAPFSWLMHDVERNLSLLNAFSNPQKPSFPEIKSGEDEVLPTGLKELKPKIGINPSSVWETKRWPAENFAALIRKLSGFYGCKIVITGGEKEKEYNALIEKSAGSENCLNLTGKTDLFGLIRTIKSLQLFITNDSGPMHIASACGIPVLAVFGPTTKELGFFPYSDKAVVLEEQLNCRPCRLHGSRSCPRKHFLCMKLITPDRVFNEAKKILKYP